MAELHDLQFTAEYAKSGRSSCQMCKGPIEKNSLRMGVKVQAPMFDGKILNWNHFECFWKRAKVDDLQEVRGIETLRWEDQEKIKECVAATAGGGAAGGGVRDDFKVEYGKSKNSMCRGCEHKIAQDLVRISKKEYDSQRAKMFGPQDQWYHVDCFVDIREDLDFGEDMGAESLKGFAHLRKEDKDMLIEKLGKGKSGARKKQAAGGDGNSNSATKAKKETALEKNLGEQSQLLWNMRDKLTNEVSNDTLKGLLEYNDQGLPTGESKLLDAVADCMVFGALEKCKECKKGQFVYSINGYRCTGNMTAWTKCLNITKEPGRIKFRVPQEYNDVAFLEAYKYQPRECAFPEITLVDAVDGIAKPLTGLSFFIVGKLAASKAAVTKKITDLGGAVSKKVDKSTTACISSSDEVSRKSKGIKDAEKSDIQVVDESFLDADKGGDICELIKKHNLVTWGSLVEERVHKSGGSKSLAYKSAASKKQEEKMFTKHMPDKLKMMVKGGAAVDPDSKLSRCAHVLQVKSDIYNVVLGMVDVVRGKNSYYKLQLLEGDNNNGFWVFRSWGRVGTTIGGTKTERCGSKDQAIRDFKTVYLDKTNNEWDDRNNFVKYPNRFYPLDIDYGPDERETSTKLDLKDSNSSLAKPIQQLVQMLFDIESMKKTMMEFEIDLKKMPLGKLSRKHIGTAYNILSELQELINNVGTAMQFLDASNRFYTLIPHDFGMQKMPILNTADMIKNKIELLDNLLEIEIAYSLIKVDDGVAGEDPIDVHYKKLKTEIEILDKSGDEYKRLVDYVSNTHASTHTQYSLEVQEIFKIKRDGEDERYRPFHDLHNRQLLWHGSRVTNFAGILSQGFRISPPDAPRTGYMFGKGIYFADMVSKSANYCRTSKTDPIGLLILCEVALGNMLELRDGEYIQRLPTGKHSTKGLGMTAPDANDTYTQDDGLVIPMGKGTNAPIGRTSLLYNDYTRNSYKSAPLESISVSLKLEKLSSSSLDTCLIRFIVYNVAQINMKYLFMTKFKFKR